MSHELNIAPPEGTKLCRRGLHYYSVLLYRCPICRFNSKKGLVGKIVAKPYSEPVLSPEQKEKRREYIREYQRKNKERISLNRKEAYYARKAASGFERRLPAERMKEYSIWNAMTKRCTDPNNAQYVDYGGRGIKCCIDWLGKHGFSNFIIDMGRRPSENHTLDRINNNGNYEPTNCRWATPKEQARNTRSNRIIEFLGISKPLAQWADDTGIPANVIRARIDILKWDIEKALKEPSRKIRKGRGMVFNNSPLPVQAPVFKSSDFDPANNFSFVNQWASQIAIAINSLSGAVGPTVLPKGIDVQGGRVTGLSAPSHPSDAISSGHAQTQFSAQSLQPQLDLGGANSLKGLTYLYQWQQNQAIPSISSIQNQLSGGISGTVTLAKLTSGGTTGSITFTNGIITAFVNPT